MELEGTYILKDEDLDQTLLHGMKARIERNGCFINSECNIYSYKLATLFAEHELNLFEQNSGSVKQIVGWELFEIYEAAYKEGLSHFDSLFPSINLYNEYSELIIESLHQHCYHTRHDEHGFNRPWMDILFTEPYSLSSNVLAKYGFYSGILSKVKNLTNNHKAAFDKYDTGKNCPTCKTEKTEILMKLEKGVNNEPKRYEEQPDFEREIKEIINSENQFWKGIPMLNVIEHFEVMTTQKNKNKEYFITRDQLISFLKRGFLNDTSQPKQKINCSFGEKGKVILRFYEFYNVAASKFGHPNRKKKFIELFTDCFDNWEEKTINPFFKPGKVKENW